MPVTCLNQERGSWMIDVKHGPRARVRTLSDIEPKPVKWAWKRRFPLGKLSLISGDPGTGKSFLTIEIAARMTTGREWPDIPEEPTNAGDVIFRRAATENVPRLIYR